MIKIAALALRDRPSRKRRRACTRSPFRKERLLREAELTEAIIDYLAEHPRAADTLAGIAEWWIERWQIRVEIETVERVIRRLAATGRVAQLGEGDQALFHL